MTGLQTAVIEWRAFYINVDRYVTGVSFRIMFVVRVFVPSSSEELFGDKEWNSKKWEMNG